MIELLVTYEAASSVPYSAARSWMDKMVNRELTARGLSEADIISRETIEDAMPSKWAYAQGGGDAGFLRFCDKITIPGDAT